RLPAHPRPDRGAEPPGLRRAHVLLQDRCRVPGLDERPPARVPDGRRPALRAQPAAPVPDRRAGQRLARAGEPRARAWALARDAATERTRRMTAPDPRLSINQATIKYADLATALKVTADAGVQAIGLWREPVNEVGLDVAARMLSDSGLRFSSHCRGGFFTLPSGPGREAALDEDRRAIGESATR